MKGLLLFFIALVFCFEVSGQNPETFDYQTLVRNNSGKLVVSRPVSFRLSILLGNSSGVVVYSETQTVTTDSNGLAALVIGEGADRIGSLATINWDSDTYFLKVETDPAGGSEYTEMSNTQLLNIPSEFQKRNMNRSSETVIEDEFFLTRKYVGEYIDYRHTGPDTNNGPNIIWIKTSMDKSYGKLSAYGKSCEFTPGDKLYIRRIFYSPGGVTGYWVYQIENNSTKFYRLSEFQYDKKVYVETLFSR